MVKSGNGDNSESRALSGVSMRSTKDQKELHEILMLANKVMDNAYSLFSRRLDTRRNVDSFVLLGDAFNLLKQACNALQEAESKVPETKATAQVGVLDEIMVRTGRAKIVDEGSEADNQQTLGVVLPFPERK